MFAKNLINIAQKSKKSNICQQIEKNSFSLKFLFFSEFFNENLFEKINRISKFFSQNIWKKLKNIARKPKKNSKFA